MGKAEDIGAGMDYQYIAFDKQGNRTAGQIEADNESEAERVLWEQGLTVARLSPSRQRVAWHTLFPTFFGVKKRDLIVFSRQLATLLESGIAILPALQLLARQTTSRALEDLLTDAIDALQEGQSLSAALGEHPQTFPALYIQTIRVGERTGNMAGVLRQMADYLEKEVNLARKLRDALAYPILVLVVAVFVVVLMLTVALPPMVDLFASFGADLPWPTRAIIAASHFATDYGLYVLIGGLALAALGAWWGSTPSGRRVRDRFLLRLPILGRLILEGQTARFARTTSVLIRAGLPLSDVIDLALETVDNVVIQDALEEARTSLLGGQGLSTPLEAQGFFPSLLPQMVRVGEETGTLDESLTTLADFYEDEVDRKTKLLVSFVEPALTVFVAVVVGFIAVSMVMPMYSILSSIE